MNTEIKQELYESPYVEIIEMSTLPVVCASQQNAGNQGYGSNDYQW